MVEPIPIKLKPSDPASRQSELDVKAQKIKAFNPYIQTPREEAYFTWLSERRQVLHSGVVFTSDDTTLSIASQVYRALYSKRKGNLYRIPMPVLYVKTYEPGRPRDLLIAILEGLGHQFCFGPLRDLRKRAWATLQDFGVEQMIVDHANGLTFESLKELVHIKTHCGLSVQLLGDFILKEILTRRKYTGIYNHFLNFHNFKPLSKSELQVVIQTWEEMSRDFAPPLGIADKDMIKFLHKRTGGLIQPLYDLLKAVAQDRLQHPSQDPLSLAQLNNYCCSTFRAEVLKG